MRRNVEQRLEFIEFRLYWEGQINRADLTKQFGISAPQATSDLQRYADEAGPRNLVYDPSAKAYLAGPDFQPIFYSPSARRYLSYLRGITDDVYRRSETWVGRLPEFGTVPLVRRRLDAPRLRKVLRAIRHKAAVRIEYQSMSRPEPMWRWVSPHALGFDGFRWHVRAWCHVRERFRDFVLARMLADGETRPSEIEPMSDVAWHKTIGLCIAPHPSLIGQARRIIELDYGMEDGQLEIRSRLSLSFYLMRHLRLDLDATLFHPEQQQIVLLNRDEVENAQRRHGVIPEEGRGESVSG